LDLGIFKSQNQKPISFRHLKILNQIPTIFKSWKPSKSKKHMFQLYLKSHQVWWKNQWLTRTNGYLVLNLFNLTNNLNPIGLMIFKYLESQEIINKTKISPHTQEMSNGGLMGFQLHPCVKDNIYSMLGCGVHCAPMWVSY
jgi:hypothetical protein